MLRSARSVNPDWPGQHPGRADRLCFQRLGNVGRPRGRWAGRPSNLRPTDMSRLAHRAGVSRGGASCTEPGSPWQNPYVESFGGRLRDELLAVEAFNTLLEAQVWSRTGRIEYNTVRPHTALGYRTPLPRTPEPRSSLSGSICDDGNGGPGEDSPTGQIITRSLNWPYYW